MFIGVGFEDLFYDLRLNSAVAVFSIFSTQMLGESMSRKMVALLTCSSIGYGMAGLCMYKWPSLSVVHADRFSSANIIGVSHLVCTTLLVFAATADSILTKCFLPGLHFCRKLASKSAFRWCPEPETEKILLDCRKESFVLSHINTALSCLLWSVRCHFLLGMDPAIRISPVDGHLCRLHGRQWSPRLCPQPLWGWL